MELRLEEIVQAIVKQVIRAEKAEQEVELFKETVKRLESHIKLSNQATKSKDES